MKILQNLAQLVDRDTVKIPQTDATGVQVQQILQIVFAIAGAVAILMIVIGGFQYVLSNADPQKTAKAKDTILYAVIGLVVAIFAQVIVTFVLDEVFS